MGEKVGFTNCVFEKLCFSENTIFIVFSAKHMAKWCFLGLFFFEVLMLLWFVFGVFGIVPEVLKMLVFPRFWGLLWGGLFLFILGLEGLGVFVFLVFVFVFLCCFCFCFVCFVFVLLLDCFLVLFFLLLFCFFFSFVFFVLVFVVLIFFVFVFCCFDFFGGFKGQVRWPKGPPHLALNPP